MAGKGNLLSVDIKDEDIAAADRGAGNIRDTAIFLSENKLNCIGMHFSQISRSKDYFYPLLRCQGKGVLQPLIPGLHT